MRCDVNRLFDLHAFARTHGAKAQQNRIFGILLGLAIAGRHKIYVEIHTDDIEAYDLSKMEDSLVAVRYPAMKKRVRAPLCKPLDIGSGSPRHLRPAVIAAIGIIAEVVAKDETSGGSANMSHLSPDALRKLERDIQDVAGGVVPEKYFVSDSSTRLARVA